MRHLFILLLFVLSLSVNAQTRSLIKAAPHNGGNGGDSLEIALRYSLDKISSFLISPEGEAIFASSFDVKHFHKTASAATLRVVQDKLIDKFGVEKCALNYPEEILILFSRKCVERLVNDNFIGQLYVLLSHEILNLMGIELPDISRGSTYTHSTKISQMAYKIAQESDSINLQQTSIIVSKTCELAYYGKWGRNDFKLDSKLQKTLRMKGYVLVNNESYDGDQTSMSLFVAIKMMDDEQISDLKKGSSVKASSAFRLKGDTFSIYPEELLQIKNANSILHLELREKRSSKTHEVVVPAKSKINMIKTGLKVLNQDSVLMDAILKLPVCMKY